LFQLVSGEADTTILYGFGEAAADWAKNKCRYVALRLKREIEGLAREFDAAVELETGFLEEFGRKGKICRAVNTPKPKLFLVALEETERLLEFLHCAIEGRGEEENAQIPGMARVLSLDADAVLTSLVPLDAAAVVIPELAGSRWRRFAIEVSLR